MKHLEIIPDILSMYGVFTSQSTSQVRQEMSISTIKWRQRPDMAIAVDWDVKHQFKQTNKLILDS